MNAPGTSPQFAPDAVSVIKALQALRQGSPLQPGYWEQVASSLRFLCRATSVWVVRQAGTDGAVGRLHGDWLLIGESSDSASAQFDLRWLEELTTLVPRAEGKGFAVGPGTTTAGLSVFRVVVRLEHTAASYALLEIPQRERANLNELVLRAQLVADLPGDLSPVPPPPAASSPVAIAAARAGGVAAAGQGGGDGPPQVPAVLGGAADGAAPAPIPASQVIHVPLADLLDLASQAMRQQHSGAAQLTIVNGLAAFTGAAQVAFGWSDHGYVRASTISHLDRFEHHSELVEYTESALDESLEYEFALRSPARPDEPVFAAQDRLRDEQGFRHVCAMSLRRGLESAPGAVLIAHADDRTVDDATLANIRMMFDLTVPWLLDLREREKWWGKRLRDWTAVRLGSLVGPQHVWLKALGVAVGLFALYATFATWDYRVNGGGQLTTDSTRLISASFEGRVDSANVTSGDLVREGDVLSMLDTRELRQQESDARAEIRRYAAEADKARASSAWAEVEIATARQQQSDARLARVLDMIEQSTSRAPFDGVVVEGERKDLLGAPVRKGDKMFKLARIEGLYVVVTVPERDMPLITPNATGELVLVSRPDVKIPLRVIAVIPVAQTKGQDGNQFMVRAEVQQAPEAWWRPGMSGAVRIDAGEKNVAWILTHRLVDKLRLMLWW
jgi:multidrug efflux pump subunit AcrA (membrane-fusion protein)